MVFGLQGTKKEISSYVLHLRLLMLLQCLPLILENFCSSSFQIFLLPHSFSPFLAHQLHIFLSFDFVPSIPRYSTPLFSLLFFSVCFIFANFYCTVFKFTNSFLCFNQVVNKPIEWIHFLEHVFHVLHFHLTL